MDGVELAQSYWSLEAPPLKSLDGTQALVLAGAPDEAVTRVVKPAAHFALRILLPPVLGQPRTARQDSPHG